MDPLSLLGGLAGGAMNLFGQNQTNKMQAEMMQQQQSFQERMSSTAYQRASTDMQAAGLNPMMMFSSGSAASTPSGASPSPMVKSGLDADSMQKAVSTATQARVASATIDNLVAQNAKIKAETLTEANRPALVAADTRATSQRGFKDSAEEHRINTSIPIVSNEALTAANQSRMNPTARKILDVGSFSGKKVGDTISPITDIISSAKGVKWLMNDRFHY